MSGSNPIVPLGSPPPSENAFQIHTRLPLVRFLSRAVQPPSQVYVTESDDIVVGCASSQAGETVTVSYRLLRADGDLVLGQFQLHPAADRSLTIHQESLAEGFLLSVSCKAAAATTRGQTFVRVFLTDPALGGGQPSYMLMADYVTTAMAPAHPNGRVLAPSEGPGWRHALVGSAPAAGAEWVLTVPTNARWGIKSLANAFLTSGAAGNRFANVRVITGGQEGYLGFAEALQTPGTLASISYASTRNQPVAGQGAFYVPFLIDGILGAGDRVQSQTVGIAAGDQYSAPEAYLEEWLDNV